MTSYASSIFDVLSLGAGLASLYRGEKLHKSTLEHDKELHVRGIASSTEQHFQELCAELLTAAKEADRDVWEQRNGQFNNLMLSSTLMFGVAVASSVDLCSFSPRYRLARPSPKDRTSKIELA